MKAVYSSETSIDFYRTIRQCVPGNETVRTDRCENQPNFLLMTQLAMSPYWMESSEWQGEEA
jgi:hypothetical protein